MHLLLLCVCVGVALAAQPVQITNSWNGGFQGKFTLHPDTDLDNWKVHLVFSKPVDKIEIWRAQEVSHTGNEFVFQNIDFDAHLAAGSNLDIDIVGRAPGDQPPTATFCIEGVDCSGSNPGPVTSAPATSAPSSGGNPTAAPAGTSGGASCSGGSAMKYDYGHALELSTLFYDAQRSGRLPANNPIPWRQDSAVNDGDNGHDLSGGWYDAGDNVKFNLPMTYSTWVLGWGMLKFKDGYKCANQIQKACDMIKTPLDYFLKCWIPSEQTLYVQVGDGYADHGFWGRPENMNMARPAYKVNAGCHGADVAADTASAFAVGAMLFKDMCHDNGYATKLLDAAKSVYTFAKNNRGVYTNCVTQAKDFYGSTGDQDELATASAFLNMATGDAGYLADSKGFHAAGVPWALSWDDTKIANDLLLYSITKDGSYKADVEAFVKSYMTGGSVSHTPCGLAYRDQWGANRYAGNAAFIAVMAAKEGIQPDAFKKFAMSQVNYILGDNNKHMSYMVGFGNSYPQHAHHRGSSCPTTTTQCDINNGGPNPNLLKGALVGGPDNGDNYQDVRTDYVKNEVACDYNAGFQGALAGLVDAAANNDLPAAPAAKC